MGAMTLTDHAEDEVDLCYPLPALLAAFLAALFAAAPSFAAPFFAAAPSFAAALFAAASSFAAVVFTPFASEELRARDARALVLARPDRGSSALVVRVRRVRLRTFAARRKVARWTIVTWRSTGVQRLGCARLLPKREPARSLHAPPAPPCDESDHESAARDEREHSLRPGPHPVFAEHAMSCCRSRAMCTSYGRVQAPYLVVRERRDEASSRATFGAHSSIGVALPRERERAAPAVATFQGPRQRFASRQVRPSMLHQPRASRVPHLETRWAPSRTHRRRDACPPANRAAACGPGRQRRARVAR